MKIGANVWIKAFMESLKALENDKSYGTTDIK
jgi:hypothetical protein